MESTQAWPRQLKWIVIAWIAFFVALFAVTNFLPVDSQVQRASAYFSPEEIERGLTYSQQHRWISWASIVVHLAFFAWLVLAGGGRWLADKIHTTIGRRWFLTVLCLALFCLVAELILAVPFRIARLEIMRQWGMTNRSVGDWLYDFAISSSVSVSIKLGVVAGLFLLIRVFPAMWWCVAAVGGTLAGFVYAFLLPIVISPLFNDFTLLDCDPQWSFLRPNVQRLADRAGLMVDEIYVMDASRRSQHSNAYFTGFGSSKRIVLYDTLLTAHIRPHVSAVTAWVGLGAAALGYAPVNVTPAIYTQRKSGEMEIETILAHEMGHWQHNHIALGICLAGVGGLIGFFAIAGILQWSVGKSPFHIKSSSDAAAVPLVWLLIILAMWLAMPVRNIVSRHFERQADMASLNITEQPMIFIATEKKMARDNFDNVAPNPIAVWFFASHPPTVERIEMGVRWLRDRAPPSIGNSP